MKKKDTIHTINNILASISLHAEMITREIPSQQKKYAKNIIADTKKISKLLKEIDKEN